MLRFFQTNEFSCSNADVDNMSEITIWFETSVWKVRVNKRDEWKASFFNNSNARSILSIKHFCSFLWPAMFSVMWHISPELSMCRALWWFTNPSNSVLQPQCFNFVCLSGTCRRKLLWGLKIIVYNYAQSAINFYFRWFCLSTSSWSVMTEANTLVSLQ